jgi:Trypsin-like peptidase domain
LMRPLRFVAAIFLLLPSALPGQVMSTLHIRVLLADAAGAATPVPRYLLLVSDNPATAPPREVVTGTDGTAHVKLPAGSYTVESDRPFVFAGKRYEWTQTIDVPAGRDTVLELTLANAQVVTVPSGTAEQDADPSALLAEWQDSVIPLWTPTTRVTGFLVDAKGLIATNQRVIGAATTPVEVQITPAIKVAARVLEADPARGVAVLWVGPSPSASLRPLPLGCADTTTALVAKGQTLYTIGAALHEPKRATPGTVSIVARESIVADFILAPDTQGGPVFAGDGVVGITSIEDEQESRIGDARVVRTEAVCEVVASAEKQMTSVPPPSAARLPIEPTRPFPVEALEEAARRPATGSARYQVSSSDFDIVFITPPLAFAEERRLQERGDHTRSVTAANLQQELVRPLTDFGNWSEYVEDFPPVLLVRATPRMVQGFWTMVARGAALTQGVSVPAIKHFKAGFSRMRAFCGETEVVAIHPFVIERQLSETDAIREGLYVFDPGALGPQCGSVRLVLYSEKDPDKGDEKVIAPTVIQQVWQDFAPYRGVN